MIADGASQSDLFPKAEQQSSPKDQPNNKKMQFMVGGLAAKMSPKSKPPPIEVSPRLAQQKKGVVIKHRKQDQPEAKARYLSNIRQVVNRQVLEDDTEGTQYGDRQLDSPDKMGTRGFQLDSIAIKNQSVYSNHQFKPHSKVLKTNQAESVSKRMQALVDTSNTPFGLFPAQIHQQRT